MLNLPLSPFLSRMFCSFPSEGVYLETKTIPLTGGNERLHNWVEGDKFPSFPPRNQKHLNHFPFSPRLVAPKQINWQFSHPMECVWGVMWWTNIFLNTCEPQESRNPPPCGFWICFEPFQNHRLSAKHGCFVKQGLWWGSWSREFITYTCLSFLARKIKRTITIQRWPLERGIFFGLWLSVSLSEGGGGVYPKRRNYPRLF